MTLMQCPAGHPPGPQEFCPICGRRCVPVATEVAPERPSDAAPTPVSSWEPVRDEQQPAPDGPPDVASDTAPTVVHDLGGGAPDQPPAFGAPQPSPAAPPPPFATSPPQPAGMPGPGGPGEAGGEAGGEAAAKARELIAELSAQAGGAGATIPSQPPGGLPPAPPGAPATPYLSPESPVPSFGAAAEATGALPSYTPQDPSALGFSTGEPASPAASPVEPRSPGQWSDGSEPPPPGRLRRGGAKADGEVAADEAASGGSRRLLPVLLLLLVLLGAGYLVKTQLLDSGNDTTTTAPPVRTSTAPSPRTLSPAELAASLQDPHFKHGYDWGKSAGAVAAPDRESTCRTEALKERGTGYPWGAHDRAGCLIALNG